MENQKPVIGVVGIGMVGKEVMRYFSENGWKMGKNLLCFDIDAKKGFSDNLTKANVVFICVPTPRAKDGSCDTSFVESAVGIYDRKDRIVVVKSTVEPGTVAKLQKKAKGALMFNPEFLTESRAWEDFMHPDRQVVGHTTKSLEHSSHILNLLPRAYFSSPSVLGTYEFVRANSSEAEMGKYASNVFGALKVTYANILADFASALSTRHAREGIKMKVSYENIRKMVAHDGRIGDAWMDVYHGSYRGFGGYCFPKDLDAFIHFGKKTLASLTKKKDQDLRVLLTNGIRMLEAARKYNNDLLKMQGHDTHSISAHDHELKKIINKNKKNNHGDKKNKK